MIEHIIRTTHQPEGEGREPVVKLTTLEEVVRNAYSWGRTDGRSAATGHELFGVGKGWTVTGVPLDDLRSTFETAHRDG